MKITETTTTALVFVWMQCAVHKYVNFLIMEGVIFKKNAEGLTSMTEPQ